MVAYFSYFSASGIEKIKSEAFRLLAEDGGGFYARTCTGWHFWLEPDGTYRRVTLNDVAQWSRLMSFIACSLTPRVVKHIDLEIIYKAALAGAQGMAERAMLLTAKAISWQSVLVFAGLLAVKTRAT